MEALRFGTAAQGQINTSLVLGWGLGALLAPHHLLDLKRKSWGSGVFLRRIPEVRCKDQVPPNGTLLAQSRTLFSRGDRQFCRFRHSLWAAQGPSYSHSQTPSSERESECWPARGRHGALQGNFSQECAASDSVSLHPFWGPQEDSY